MRSPNWKEEELKLALELYLSKDMAWLAKMRDSTSEIVALSQLLNQLDLFPQISKPDKFRSCGSIRMKLSNFKSLDEQYGKSSLSNIGILDKEIWNEYHNRYDELVEDCCHIVRQHLRGASSSLLSDYLLRYNDSVKLNIKEDFGIFAKDTYYLAEQYRIKFLSETDLQLSQRIINTCFEIMKALEWCQNDQNNNKNDQSNGTFQYKEHGGINQAPIGSNTEKIGAYVQRTMGELISEGKITQEIINDLTDVKWSRETFHLGHPFLIKIDRNNQLREQLRDSNGHLRYWKRIYSIEDHDYCICKEWFKSGRKYYDKWLDSIKKRYSLDLTREQLLSILQFIKISDEKSISIKREELYQKMADVNKKENVLEKMIENGLLSAFQGTERELVVDDYDLLFEMIDHPEKYIL